MWVYVIIRGIKVYFWFISILNKCYELFYIYYYILIYRYCVCIVYINEGLSIMFLLIKLFKYVISF